MTNVTHALRFVDPRNWLRGVLIVCAVGAFCSICLPVGVALAHGPDQAVTLGPQELAGHASFQIIDDVDAIALKIDSDPWCLGWIGVTYLESVSSYPSESHTFSVQGDWLMVTPAIHTNDTVAAYHLPDFDYTLYDDQCGVTGNTGGTGGSGGTGATGATGPTGPGVDTAALEESTDAVAHGLAFLAGLVSGLFAIGAMLRSAW